MARSGVVSDSRTSVLQGKVNSLDNIDITKQKLDKHEAGETSWIDDIPYCPVYTPTKEEFEDPLRYLQSITPEASKFGICKIVPPVVATVPAGVVLTKEQAGFKFTTRVQPMRLAKWDEDDKVTFHMSGCKYSFAEFERMANKAYARKFATAASLPSRFIEAEFWRETVSGKTLTVEYACDVEGSAFSTSPLDPLGQSKWNLKTISRLSQSTLRLLEAGIPGVTEPMLYIGMLFSMFAWHVEDHYLYSISYHHCGAPKTWYGVPGHAAPDFEKFVQEHVYDRKMLSDTYNGAAYDMLIGKTTMFAPRLLHEHGVPVSRAIQCPGEFVVTFPRAYHAGFSHGFNCGEAVNFAMADWFPFGAAACRRYELLSRLPLLPQEELLCKEAMILAKAEKAHSGATEECLSMDISHRKSLKVSFVALMRFQHQVHWLLRQKGARTSKLLGQSSLLCGLCKHACYVACITCQCVADPVCLNHGKEIRQCKCGNGRSIMLRDDWPHLIDVANSFEMEAGILEAAQKEPAVQDSSTMDASFLEENLLSTDDYKLYERNSNGNVCDQRLSHDMVLALRSPPDDVLATNLKMCVESTASRDQQENTYNDTAAKRNLDVPLTSALCGSIQNGAIGSCCLQQEFSTSVASADDDKDKDSNNDSDMEVFRVKRRRVSSSGKKNSQRDVSGKSTKKLLSGGKLLPEHSSIKKTRQDCPKLISVQGGEYAFLIQDVANHLGLSGTVTEIVDEWQLKLFSNALTLKMRRVKIKGQSHLAVSLKCCKVLKKIITDQQSKKLQDLIDEAYERLKKVIAKHRKEDCQCVQATTCLKGVSAINDKAGSVYKPGYVIKKGCENSSIPTEVNDNVQVKRRRYQMQCTLNLENQLCHSNSRLSLSSCKELSVPREGNKMKKVQGGTAKTCATSSSQEAETSGAACKCLSPRQGVKNIHSLRETISSLGAKSQQLTKYDALDYNFGSESSCLEQPNSSLKVKENSCWPLSDDQKVFCTKRLSSLGSENCVSSTSIEKLDHLLNASCLSMKEVHSRDASNVSSKVSPSQNSLFRPSDENETRKNDDSTEKLSRNLGFTSEVTKTQEKKEDSLSRSEVDIHESLTNDSGQKVEHHGEASVAVSCCNTYEQSEDASCLLTKPLSSGVDLEAKRETAWCPNQEASSSYAGHGGGCFTSYQKCVVGHNPDFHNLVADSQIVSSGSKTRQKYSYTDNLFEKEAWQEGSRRESRDAESQFLKNNRSSALATNRLSFSQKDVNSVAESVVIVTGTGQKKFTGVRTPVYQNSSSSDDFTKRTMLMQGEVLSQLHERNYKDQEFSCIKGQTYEHIQAQVSNSYSQLSCVSISSANTDVFSKIEKNKQSSSFLSSRETWKEMLNRTRAGDMRLKERSQPGQLDNVVTGAWNTAYVRNLTDHPVDTSIDIPCINQQSDFHDGYEMEESSANFLLSNGCDPGYVNSSQSLMESTYQQSSFQSNGNLFHPSYDKKQESGHAWRGEGGTSIIGNKAPLESNKFWDDKKQEIGHAWHGEGGTSIIGNKAHSLESNKFWDDMGYTCSASSFQHEMTHNSTESMIGMLASECIQISPGNIHPGYVPSHSVRLHQVEISDILMAEDHGKSTSICQRIKPEPLRKHVYL